MPSKVTKNVFYKGMNLDADITTQPDGTYREAYEFRLAVNEDATFGTLSNVKGNTIFVEPSIAPDTLNANDQIVGSVSVADHLVLWVTDSLNQDSYIYKCTIDDETLTSIELIWSDVGKASEDKLNLNYANRIKAVSRKEAEDLLKVYWVDNNNYLRYANIADNLTTDGNVYNSAENDYISAKSFGTVASVTFVEPEIQAISGGGLKVGMVQYAYQLYNKNGSETSFSPATGLFHLTSSAESGGNSTTYKGNAVEDNSGKSLSFEVDLSTYEYDRVRVVSIHYEYYEQLPTINIVGELPITADGTVRFTDSGSGYIGSYTIEQFTAIAGLYKAKDIASSKNYLFLANVTENYFNIGDYDARAYRFNKSSDSLTEETCTITSWTTTTITFTSNKASFIGSHHWLKITLPNIATDHYHLLSVGGSSGNYTLTIDITGRGLTQQGSTLVLEAFNYDRARMDESNGDLYFIYRDGFWYKTDSTGYAVIYDYGSDWSIPENADLINPYNNTLQDGNRYNNANADEDIDYLGNFKYSYIGNLGGSGKNVEYTIGIQSMYIDDNTYVYRIGTSRVAEDLDGNDTVGYEGYASPYNTAYKRSYQRDETYRFGIVFIDKFGRESVVKWIGDIRMPGMDGYQIATYAGGLGSVRPIYPIFTVNAYPEGAVSYKIVRVERSVNDMSVVASGLLRPTAYRPDDAGNQSYHSGRDLNLPSLSTNLQEFISPEISFYKEFNVKSSDYLEIHNVGNQILWDLEDENVPTTVGQDAVIKYRSVSYYGSRKTTTITGGKVIGPGEPGESFNIDGLDFYPFWQEQDGGSEDGYTGTSLILSTFNNDWTYSGTDTDDAVQYAMYKRHVYTSQYGGQLYVNRSNNEYIGCSAITSIPSNGDPTTVRARQGDIFITYMDHTAIYYYDAANDCFVDFIFPVESGINLTLRHDDAFTKMYSTLTNNYWNLKEEGNTEENLSELYLYNTVYSQENNSKKYFPLPEGEEPSDSEVYTTRVLVSEKKFNGEESDSWLSFLSNNFIDVDANYGEINNIMDYSNNLLFWQSSAFGIIDVDPRSLITDNNPGALVLGTGAVLSRFDYLSTMTGNTDLFGLLKTPRGIYWYDNENCNITRYNGKSIERLSKILGIQSYINDNKFESSIVGYFPKYDEVLFSLSNSTTDSTLVFNEMANAFTGFYKFDPIIYIHHKNITLSSDSKDELWLHDSVGATYSSYYGNTVEDSVITIPINPIIDLVKVFDGINFSSYVYDSTNNDALMYDSTFYNARFYNSYQNTDWITLTPGTNIERKKGMWSMFIPRNVLNVDPSTNPDIFDNNNFDPNQPFKPRMRDTYLIADLKFDNTSNYRFKFPFMHTKYRANYR